MLLGITTGPTINKTSKLGMKDEHKLMTVARFYDQMSAEITAGMLNANGIAAEVFGQTSAYPSINAAIDCIEVKVNADDYESAKNLLAANDKAE